MQYVPDQNINYLDVVLVSLFTSAAAALLDGTLFCFSIRIDKLFIVVFQKKKKLFIVVSWRLPGGS